MTRRGILQVYLPIRGRAKACLPPEHKICAVRSQPVLSVEDWLIEGPMMPPCMDGFEPERIRWAFSIDRTVDGSLILSAEFTLGNWNCRSLGEWTIGTWPSADAYQDWLIGQG